MLEKILNKFMKLKHSRMFYLRRFRKYAERKEKETKENKFRDL
jgi:hypothetical protein